MPFDFYFAGTQCDEAEELMCELNANVLKSYVNDQRSIKNWFERKKNGWKGKLMIDNGEFTFHRKGGTLDIDKYIQWLNDNDDYIDYAIALDKIPGKWGERRTRDDILEAPRQTWKNYLYMIKKVKSPDKLLPVFHQYDSFEWLDKMLTSGICKYICLSGNKELVNSQRESWYSRCYDYIRRFNPDIKVHCLGSATIQNAEKFPFTSMDATSWIMAGANGSILTEHGAIYIGKQAILSESQRRMLTKLLSKYDITLEEAAEDYKMRMVVNVNYLYEVSRRTEFRGFKYRRKELF